MKKLAMFFFLAAILVWPGEGLAMQFSSPVLLGGLSGLGYGKGGPADSPYNHRSTSLEGQYYDFGRDKDHVIRYYYYPYSKNNYKHAEIGPADNPGVRYEFWLGLGEIYEIQSDVGTRFYITTARGDVYYEINIFGRDKSGQFVRYLNSRDLQKYRWNDNGGSLVNPTAVFVRGDTIVLDCESRDRSGRSEHWQYILKWDDKAQWFGIDYKVL